MTKVTIEMAASINGLIATEEGSEDFLKDYDCLVCGNRTFQNVISW